MTWRELLAAYLEARRPELRPSTLVSYAWGFGMWRGFCEQVGLHEPAATRPRHLEAYLAHLRSMRSRNPHDRGRPLKPSHVFRNLVVLRHFFRWATRQGALLIDPTRDLEIPNPNRPLLDVLTVAEVERLLATPDESPLGLRDQAILECLYGLGIRAGECHQLDLDDVDVRGRTLFVREGKGLKDRALPMGEVLAEALSRYLGESRAVLSPRPSERALFVTAQNRRRLSRIGLKSMLRRRCLEAGLAIVGPHALRHAFATHLLEGGAELRRSRPFWVMPRPSRPSSTPGFSRSS